MAVRLTAAERADLERIAGALGVRPGEALRHLLREAAAALGRAIGSGSTKSLEAFVNETHEQIPALVALAAADGADFVNETRPAEAWPRTGHESAAGPEGRPGIVKVTKAAPVQGAAFNDYNQLEEIL